MGNEGHWDETVCAVKLPKCERLSCTNIVEDVVQIVSNESFSYTVSVQENC